MGFPRLLAYWGCSLLLGLWLSGCKNGDQAAEGAQEPMALTTVSHLSQSTMIATINGAPVTVKKFERTFSQRLKMMKIKREDVSKVEHQLMETGTFESLVSRTILLQEAQKRGFTVDNERLQAAKKQIFKTLPEGMTPELFINDMGITMKTFEEEVREDMLIGKLQEAIDRAGSISFDKLISRLERDANIKMIHAPGGGEWNKKGTPNKTPGQASPTPNVNRAPGQPQKHWRDQSKDLRREKAKAAGLKPWDEGYPE